MDAIGGIIDLVTTFGKNSEITTLAGIITLLGIGYGFLKKSHHLIWYADMNSISSDPKSSLPRSRVRAITRASNRDYRRRIMTKAIGTMSVSIIVVSLVGWMIGMGTDHDEIVTLATEWTMIGIGLGLLGVGYSIVHKKVIYRRLHRSTADGD